MKIKFKAALFRIIILLSSLTASQRIFAVEEQQWKPVPEANYAEALELITLRAKANYEGISSWRGQINILAADHYYGENAAEKSHGVYPNSIARDSQHVCRISQTVAEFAVDMRNDKLYSSVEPDIRYRAVDLGQDIPPDKYRGKPAITKVVLTPEHYIWYMLNGKFHSQSQKGAPGETVFIESSQNENVKGFVQDPRRFFYSGGENRTLWETLSQIRSHMDERLKTRVAGYPHIEIYSLETKNGTKYRILTTWKGAEHYVIKYIRILLEVDEAVGFNATKVETTNPDGTKTDLKEYTYEKIRGIYLPKTIRKELRNNKGEVTDTSEITIETTGINKSLPEDTFTIKNLGLEEDTLVSDKIKKAEFRYRKGNLIPIAEQNE